MSLDISCFNRAHLGFCYFLNSQLATVVAARRAYGVVDVVSTAVRANSQCWHLCHVMSTTFRLSGVRLSSFRMCHILLFLLLVLFMYCPSSLFHASHAELLTRQHHTLAYHCRLLRSCRGGFGEVQPFRGCNHRLGDYAPTQD